MADDTLWTKRPLKQRGRRSAPTNRQSADQLADLRRGAQAIAERERLEEQARMDVITAELRRIRDEVIG